MSAIKTFKVSKYNNELKGVIHYNNQEIALKGVLCNELVDVNITQKGKMSHYEVVKIKTPSENRVNPKCKIYRKCGGCTLQHINYIEQLNMKTKYVEELFKNACRGSYQINHTIGMVDPRHYRNKNQIVFKFTNGKLISGFYEEGTHNVINYDECYIQDQIINKVVIAIKEIMIKMKIAAYDEDRGSGIVRHILVKRSRTTNEIMVVIVTGKEFPGKNNFVKSLLQKFPTITTIIHNVNSRKTSAVLGEKEYILYGKGYIIDILMDKKFKISSKSFYQINSEQTEKLYQSALESAQITLNDVVLDAYCGVGTIGIIASSIAKRVIGVEIVKEAINDAIFNSKINNITNTSFICDDATHYMMETANRNEKIDVVIMDPPRKGSDQKFLESLIKLSPKKIVYVSCNPQTQVRDLKTLLSNQYVIKAIQPVDMFPHTSHVECVVLLHKK